MLVLATGTTVRVEAFLAVHREALHIQLSDAREDFFFQRVLDIGVVGHLPALDILNTSGQVCPRRILLHRLLLRAQSSDTARSVVYLSFLAGCDRSIPVLYVLTFADEVRAIGHVILADLGGRAETTVYAFRL